MAEDQALGKGVEARLGLLGEAQSECYHCVVVPFRIMREKTSLSYRLFERSAFGKAFS